ncbi:MAG: hypothetical protein VZQ80_05210 [Lachnospiraceae bacterium]|nr:hypothetical protein [Lachnospiraceae bacterium]
MKIKTLTRRICANTAHAWALQKLPNENQVAHTADLDKYRPYLEFAEAFQMKSKSLTRRIWANTAHTRALQKLSNEK